MNGSPAAATARVLAVIATTVTMTGCGHTDRGVVRAYGGLSADDARVWTQAAHDNDRIVTHYFAMVRATRESRLAEARRRAHEALQVCGTALARIGRIRNARARRALTGFVRARAGYIRAWDDWVVLVQRRGVRAARRSKPVVRELRRAGASMNETERRFYTRIRPFLRGRELAAFRRRLADYRRRYTAAFGRYPLR